MSEDFTGGDVAKVRQESIEWRARKAEERFNRNRFTQENAPKPLIDSGCNQESWPTKNQYKRWFKFVIKSLPPDPDGAWYAVCPIYSKDKPAGNTRKPTAIFDFPSGTIRCLHENPCHAPRRAMSLSRIREIRLLGPLES